MAATEQSGGQPQNPLTRRRLLEYGVKVPAALAVGSGLVLAQNEAPNYNLTRDGNVLKALNLPPEGLLSTLEVLLNGRYPENTNLPSLAFVIDFRRQLSDEGVLVEHSGYYGFVTEELYPNPRFPFFNRPDFVYPIPIGYSAVHHPYTSLAIGDIAKIAFNYAETPEGVFNNMLVFGFERTRIGIESEFLGRQRFIPSELVLTP
jgi:hypothetical protein